MHPAESPSTSSNVSKLSNKSLLAVAIGIGTLVAGAFTYLFVMTSLNVSPETSTPQSASNVAEIQPPSDIDRDRWEKCRSVQQVVPADEAGENSSNKQRNAQGEVRIPPKDQARVWNV